MELHSVQTFSGTERTLSHWNIDVTVSASPWISSHKIRPQAPTTPPISPRDVGEDKNVSEPNTGTGSTDGGPAGAVTPKAAMKPLDVNFSHQLRQKWWLERKWWQESHRCTIVQF